MKLRKLMAMFIGAIAIVSCTTSGGDKSKVANGDDAADSFDNKDSITVIIDKHSNGNVWHKKEVKNMNYPKTGKEARWVLHGTVYEYYETPKNTLATKTQYNEGKKEGTTIKYYKSGKPYMEWFYKNGKKEGVVKKFHESGYQISEVPYKQDFLGLGSKEFNSEGEEITMPELKVWTKDDRRSKGTFTVYAKVVDKRGNNLSAEFFDGLLIDQQYAHPNLKKVTKISSDRVATYQFFESTGIPPFVNVVAKVTTGKGTPVLLTKMVQMN